MNNAIDTEFKNTEALRVAINALIEGKRRFDCLFNQETDSWLMRTYSMEARNIAEMEKFKYDPPTTESEA